MLSLQPADATVASTPTTYRVFVYHHTHWDREWWAPFQVFRARLVAVIDELLDALDRDPSFRCFLLDGQTVVLQDYLEIRPEQRDRLVALINDDRIQCGPWHILPDEFLVSGEAHIRNLMLGARTARSLGCALQPIGYLPDTFGHIAQMPQILRGFAIESAMIWRGAGGDAAQQSQEFRWQAPDGSEVLAYWFPDGYYLVDFLHFDNPAKTYDETHGRVRRTLELCAARATTDCILLPYGGDHRPIDARLPRLLDTVNNDLAGFGELHWSTPAAFLEALRACQPVLRTHRGELRAAGDGTPHLLPGVLSTRLYLKQHNDAGQRWLERYAEPLAALAWQAGARYDDGLLWAAWELLIQNHPHDSICGCSIDQVHREMLTRFDQSRQIAELVAMQSAQHLANQIDTRALGPGETALVAINTLDWPRSGVVAVELVGGDGVGPRTHALYDEQGREVPFQARDVTGLRPLSDAWRRREVRFVAADVPALGHATYRLAPREQALDPRLMHLSALQPTARLKGSAPVGDLRVGDGVLENAWLRVEADRATGTITLTDKRSGEVYAGLGALEDGGDAGDSYTHSAPLVDALLRSDNSARAHVALHEAGHAQATLRIDLEWALPEALSHDRLSRSAAYVPCRVSSFVTLAADARHVEVAVVWQNESRDHRLRALFRLGAEAPVCHAEGQFAVLTRPTGHADEGRGAAEPPAAALPQQGFVSVGSGPRALTIASRGLPEFEAAPDGTLALTLLRAVGWLSRDDMLARVGHAGPELPTPEAQCLGECRAEYAIIPHSGDWCERAAYRIAHAFLAPLYGVPTDRHLGQQLWRDGLLSIEGDHTLLLSALKKAERGDALILRFWNVADRPTTARVCLRRRPSAAYCVNLAETPVEGGMLALDDGAFVVRAGAAQIVTVAVRFEE